MSIRGEQKRPNASIDEAKSKVNEKVKCPACGRHWQLLLLETWDRDFKGEKLLASRGRPQR